MTCESHLSNHQIHFSTVKSARPSCPGTSKFSCIYILWWFNIFLCIIYIIVLGIYTSPERLYYIYLAVLKYSHVIVDVGHFSPSCSYTFINWSAWFWNHVTRSNVFCIRSFCIVRRLEIRFFSFSSISGFLANHLCWNNIPTQQRFADKLYVCRAGFLCFTVSWSVVNAVRYRDPTTFESRRCYCTRSMKTNKTRVIQRLYSDTTARDARCQTYAIDFWQQQHKMFKKEGLIKRGRAVNKIIISRTRPFHVIALHTKKNTVYEHYCRGRIYLFFIFEGGDPGPDFGASGLHKTEASA